MAPPDASQVSTLLKELNPTTEEFELVTDVADVPQTQSSISDTFEAGYKGLIGDRLLLGIDVYYSRINDFLGPLLVETPNVFIEPVSLRNYLIAEAQRLGLPLDAQTAGFVAAIMGTVPVATVTPEQVEGFDAADILLTYRNFPEFDLWGADLSFALLLGRRLSLSGSYSFVSDNFFTASQLGGIADLALNSPRNKASLSGRYHDERSGLSGELRARWVEGFPVASGVYVGDVRSYGLVDAGLSYALPISRSTIITLNVINLLTFHENQDGERVNVFDGRHREMVSAPALGRLIMLRVRQTF
jgi:iron complex outermembrane receptor protein